MKAVYIRNFVFGVEDGLVSTVGVLSGIAVAGVAVGTIFLTGVVLIFVEAFSMAAGSFLSETSAEEYSTGKNADTKHPIIAGFVMFISYFIAGLVPLLPYAVADAATAPILSISASIAALFFLGITSGTLSRTGIWRNAFRMAIIGGIAIGIGAVAGWFLS